MSLRKLKKTLALLFRSRAGYSLVELMVSGTLLSFALTAAVAVVTTGTQISTSDNFRRQARTVVRSLFEQSYDFRNYNTMPDSGIFISTPEIDAKDGNSVLGELTTTIVTRNSFGVSGSTIPVKQVTLKLKWTGAGSEPDSIEFTKIVASAQ